MKCVRKLHEVVCVCVKRKGGAKECEETFVRGLFFFFFDACSGFSHYASSSKPIPTLCPPALKFFPSIRAERVTFTPAHSHTQRISNFFCLFIHEHNKSVTDIKVKPGAEIMKIRDECFGSTYTSSIISLQLL